MKLKQLECHNVVSWKTLQVLQGCNKIVSKTKNINYLTYPVDAVNINMQGMPMSICRSEKFTDFVK